MPRLVREAAGVVAPPPPPLPPPAPIPAPQKPAKPPVPVPPPTLADRQYACLLNSPSVEAVRGISQESYEVALINAAKMNEHIVALCTSDDPPTAVRYFNIDNPEVG